MNFDYIVLTKEEIQRLHQLDEAPNGLDSGPNEKNLMEYRLITKNWYHAQTEDGDRKLEPVSIITEEGKMYLNYTSSLKRNQRKGRLHDWLIALFSAACGALLSEPLWEFIRWIFD